MLRYAGRLLVVLLAASNWAVASMILTPPSEVLVRPDDKPAPTPNIGPKFNFVRGEELVVYPRPPKWSGMDEVSYITTCMMTSVAFLIMIPRCQRVMVLLKLLDR